MLTLNTNMHSLNTQRVLRQSVQAQARTNERLSSGKRINSAKDDAAGLAIASSMTSQVWGPMVRPCRVPVGPM